jgi:hypothetical protein
MQVTSANARGTTTAQDRALQAEAWASVLTPSSKTTAFEAIMSILPRLPAKISGTPNLGPYHNALETANRLHWTDAHGKSDRATSMRHMFKQLVILGRDDVVKQVRHTLTLLTPSPPPHCIFWWCHQRLH